MQKRKTIYVTILIGCHTKCFNAIFIRARHTAPPSLTKFIMHVLFFDRPFYLESFFFLFSYFWVRAAKNYCLDLLFFSKHQALITVNNFNRRDICSPSLSPVWCVWISLKSTLAAESRFYVRLAFFVSIAFAQLFATLIRILHCIKHRFI